MTGQKASLSAIKLSHWIIQGARNIISCFTLYTGTKNEAKHNTTVFGERLNSLKNGEIKEQMISRNKEYTNLGEQRTNKRTTVWTNRKP